jgi:hypothetical protein
MVFKDTPAFLQYLVLLFGIVVELLEVLWGHFKNVGVGVD